MNPAAGSSRKGTTSTERTGELDRTLLEHEFVDEYDFWHFQVVVGRGQRLFDGIELTHLSLVASTTFDSGIAVLVYAPK